MENSVNDDRERTFSGQNLFPDRSITDKFPTVFLRRCKKLFLEEQRKIKGIFYPDLFRNGPDGVVGGDQKVGGMLQPALDQELIRRHIGQDPEEPTKMGKRYMTSFRFDRKIPLPFRMLSNLGNQIFQKILVKRRQFFPFLPGFVNLQK